MTDPRQRQYHAVKIESIDDALRIKGFQRVEAWLCEDRFFRAMKCDQRSLLHFQYSASGQHRLLGLPIYVRS